MNLDEFSEMVDGTTYAVRIFPCESCGGTHLIAGIIDDDPKYGGPWMAFLCVACGNIFLANVDGQYPHAEDHVVRWPRSIHAK